jgi:hypothetical protein
MYLDASASAVGSVVDGVTYDWLHSAVVSPSQTHSLLFPSLNTTTIHTYILTRTHARTRKLQLGAANTALITASQYRSTAAERFVCPQSKEASIQHSAISHKHPRKGAYLRYSLRIVSLWHWMVKEQVRVAVWHGTGWLRLEWLCGVALGG